MKNNGFGVVHGCLLEKYTWDHHEKEKKKAKSDE